MLSQAVGMAELKIKGYKGLVRRDRDHNGGGLMIYLSNNVRAKRRNDLESPSIETIWVECEWVSEWLSLTAFLEQRTARSI